MRIIYFIDCAGIPFVVQSHETVFRHNFLQLNEARKHYK